MVVGTPELATANLDAMSNEQLVAELKKAKEELFNLRFRSATDQLDNHGRLKAVRRDIARVNTILRERSLNIRTEPSPVTSPVKASAKAEKTADVEPDTEAEAKPVKKAAAKSKTTEKKEA
jgi:large subunit ribosomal protein L29